MAWTGGWSRPAFGQAYGAPDRDAPGDVAIQAYLAGVAGEIHGRFAEDLQSPDAWMGLDRQQRYREEYLYMLGLWPVPEPTPLEATVTGTIERDGYVVDLLHYQSRPGLYVTANLYRPESVSPGEKLPAVLYVCGHANRGRNGNKTAYQSHGIWFARHGYICLMVDTLQLGEIGALHHGTYREERWWWHSRGYTPAGVECWNGVRGIDYLRSRADVDPERIAVTGISGGGAATFWIAAADPRVTVAVPVSGMADLPSYVENRVINGHCDCMFLYNTFQWPWVRIAALVAPRPLLFVNSDADRIFPMDANERVINRLDRIYSFYGAGDRASAVVSIGGHAYREDIRQAAYRFINTHLKHDPREVTDSEIDLVQGDDHPLAPETLRVFPTDADVPGDEQNTTIDEHFVPMARVELPTEGEVDAWRSGLVDELRRVTFQGWPERVPAARVAGDRERGEGEGEGIWLETESPVRVRLTGPVTGGAEASAGRVLLWVASAPWQGDLPDWVDRARSEGEEVWVLEPRGIGPSRWTRRNPPNYVERSHVLLGCTVDSQRVWDVLATAEYLRAAVASGQLRVRVAGERAGGVLAAYAALLDPGIAGALVKDPPASHMDGAAPTLLNVLRVCDIPDVLGMLAPRPLTLAGIDEPLWNRVQAVYTADGAAGQLRRDGQQ